MTCLCICGLFVPVRFKDVCFSCALFLLPHPETALGASCDAFKLIDRASLIGDDLPIGYTSILSRTSKSPFSDKLLRIWLSLFCGLFDVSRVAGVGCCGVSLLFMYCMCCALLCDAVLCCAMCCAVGCCDVCADLAVLVISGGQSFRKPGVETLEAVG
jgi:hypothetical protein